MRKKLCWLSDSPLTCTGYGTITRNVLNGLSKNYDCIAYAHNYVGQPLPPGLTLADGTKLDFWLYGNGREQYNKDVLQARVQKHKPHYFGILLDTFMLYPWLLDLNFSPAKTFFYFPSDGGGGLPQGCDQILKYVTRAVAMSKFAQKQAKEVHGLDTHYIPHAIDTALYHPVGPEEKELIRQNMTVKTVAGTKVTGALAGRFVVGTVARNQGRKMLDRTVKAFAEFCKDKPEAVLYMHCDPFDGAAIFDIRFLISRHNLQNRVFFSDIRYFEGLDYKDMCKVYNAMDIFLLTTSGEGFGIPIIEALGCQIPVVATEYTTTKELLLDDGVCGLPVPAIAEITGSWVVERAIMNIKACVAALNKLYKEPETREHLGKTGRNKVLRNYSWEIVVPMWEKFLREL